MKTKEKRIAIYSQLIEMLENTADPDFGNASPSKFLLEGGLCTICIGSLFSSMESELVEDIRPLRTTIEGEGDYNFWFYNREERIAALKQAIKNLEKQPSIWSRIWAYFKNL